LTTLHQATYLGGGGEDRAFALAIHRTSGEVYVAGNTSSMTFPGTAGGAQAAFGGGTDAFVARLDATLTTLQQATYLGGNGADVIANICSGCGYLSGGLAIHPTSGEVYVAGSTESANFPGTAGGAQPAHATGSGSGFDAFVARLNAALTTLHQATYLGGNLNDEALALAIHPTSGEVYVAGSTASTNFPGTAGGAQPAKDGSTDAFVARLNVALTTLNQATYLGGSGNDDALALAIHPSSGDVYVSGITGSTNFPGTAGGAQPASGPGGVFDAFVARLNANLTTLNQATYLGGNGAEWAYGLAIHPTSGEVYVAGLTDSTNFPGTTGGAQPAYAGQGDAFVARLNAALTALNQATYLGGIGNFGDSAQALAIHPTSGEVYVAGFTNSTNFPGTAGGAQPAKGGSSDAFVARLTPELRAATAVNRDFNGDGKSDILWRHTSGVVYEWLMNGTSILPGSGSPGSASTDWQIVGVGDFNGDGKADILWRNTSGLVYEWLMNGTSILPESGSPGSASPDWQIVGVGDFDGDGKADILWRHTSGVVYEWLMNGTSILPGSGSPGSASPDWQIVGVGDFNGDGKADILWRQNSSGLVYIWLMNGTSILPESGSPGSASTDWQIVGVGDFDGDGKADILWRHTSGVVYEWLMNGTSILPGSGSPGSASSDWTIVRVGDFNGDGKGDILWRHTSGVVYEWLMNGTSILPGSGSPDSVSTDWTIQ